VDALTGVEVKIARAKRHLDELKEQIGIAFDPSQYRFVRQDDPDPLEYVYRIEGLPDVPLLWSAIVGDVLSNLRAALDHLAWQIVLLDGGIPNQNTYFPIVDSALDRNGHSRTVIRPGLTRPDLARAVESVQPYQDTQTTAEARSHPFWRLNNLCRVDKHRLLLVVATVLDIGNMWWGLPAEVTCSPRVITSQLEDNALVAWFKFSGDPGPHFDPHLAMSVSLFEGPPRLPIGDFLSNLCWWVDVHVMEWVFRPIFAGQPPTSPFYKI